MEKGVEGVIVVIIILIDNMKKEKNREPGES